MSSCRRGRSPPRGSTIPRRSLGVMRVSSAQRGVSTTAPTPPRAPTSRSSATVTPPGWTTTPCSWRSTKRSRARAGRRGLTGSRPAMREPWRGPAAGSRRGSGSGASCSGASTGSGRRCACTPGRAVSGCSAMHRSSWRRTAPMLGPIPSCSSSMTRAIRSRSQVYRPIISARPGSVGEIRSIAGTPMRPRATPGGWPA